MTFTVSNCRRIALELMITNFRNYFKPVAAYKKN